MSESKDEWFVYILRCLDGSYYVGSTGDLHKRVSQHISGFGGKHTSDNGVADFVYHEVCRSQAEALSREKQIKGWSRVKKEALIAGDAKRLKKLSISRQSPRNSD